MPSHRAYSAALLFGVATIVALSACAPNSRNDGPDPVTADPSVRDTIHPAGMAEVALESGGSRMNGLFYLAAGPDRHPTVVLLHGFPGNERNLDLAQALRRAGINVLYFNYRGAWGSGGSFSFGNALEDVAAAVRFVRTDSIAREFRIDPTRVALVGHSMGGWLALLGAASDSGIACVGALDFWNAGADGREFRTNRSRDSLFSGYADWLTAAGGPLHVEQGAVLSADLATFADDWDVNGQATALRSRPILLISAEENPSHPAFTAALQQAGAAQVDAHVWQTDHSFSDHRVELARTVLRWLHDRCNM
jgi:uncharacterized protein